MKKFDKIYLDMDGVIADFDQHFSELTGEACAPHEYEAKHGTIAFWDLILEQQDFFAKIKPFANMHDLIDLCKEMADKVVILSSPSKFNTSLCVEQKREWLDFYCIGDMPAIFEKEKYKFARANCLLIDDYIANIEKWTANGGEAHHFKSFEGFKEF